MVFLTLGRRQGDAKVNEMGEESVITSERRFRRAVGDDLFFVGSEGAHGASLCYQHI